MGQERRRLGLCEIVGCAVAGKKNKSNPCTDGKKDDKKDKDDEEKKNKRESPKTINFSKESNRHVDQRHIGNKPGWEHKSKWTVKSGEWRTYTRKTFRDYDRISKDGDRFVFEKEFKHPIGVDKNGDKLYKVRVVVEKDGEVVTAFPQKDWK